MFIQEQEISLQSWTINYNLQPIEYEKNKHIFFC